MLYCEWLAKGIKPTLQSTFANKQGGRTMPIIGADAVRLADLQVDALQKLRSGQLSLDHCERFLNLSPEAREERFGDFKNSKLAPPVEPVEKFALLVDLGIITVPENYKHAIQLAQFLRADGKKFRSVNDNITDANFPNPSRILKPGDKLWVRAFRQIVSDTTTSEERMVFLANQKAVHTGAQGASLVFEQRRDQLPKGFWYASFDEKGRLWEDADRHHRVPGVGAASGGYFYWYLGHFEDVWRDNYAFFCFCDELSGT